MSCDSVETRMRIRPRESSLSRPFASASFAIPHRRGEASYSVARSSPERRSRTACDRTSRRTQQVLDQRCVRPAFCQRHFDYGHPRFDRRSTGALPLPGPADAWRVSRRPTHFGCVGLSLFSRRAFLLPATSTELASSDAPVTTHRLSPGLHACACAAFAYWRRPPLTEVRRRLRACGRDHPPTWTRDGPRRY